MKKSLRAMVVGLTAALCFVGFSVLGSPTAHAAYACDGTASGALCYYSDANGLGAYKSTSVKLANLAGFNDQISSVDSWNHYSYYCLHSDADYKGEILLVGQWTKINSLSSYHRGILGLGTWNDAASAISLNC